MLIVDGSNFDRYCSKNVELLARCFDHASLKMRCYKGFRMLYWAGQMGISSCRFTLLSSKTSSIIGIKEEIDKRFSGYKCRVEVLHICTVFNSGDG